MHSAAIFCNNILIVLQLYVAAKCSRWAFLTFPVLESQHFFCVWREWELCVFVRLSVSRLYEGQWAYCGSDMWVSICQILYCDSCGFGTDVRLTVFAVAGCLSKKGGIETKKWNVSVHPSVGVSHFVWEYCILCLRRKNERVLGWFIRGFSFSFLYLWYHNSSTQSPITNYSVKNMSGI